MSFGGGFGGGLVGPALGIAGAAVGIGVLAAGTGLLFNEVNQIIPNAKSTLERERG